MQYTLDRYRNIYSAIKCPLEITADEFFVTSNLRCNPSCLYSSTNNGLLTRFMPTKYHHFACFRLATLLYVLFMCLYVRPYILKRTGLKIRIRSQMFGHLRVLNFILYLTFDGKYACFYMGVVRSISRPINVIARQMSVAN